MLNGGVSAGLRPAPAEATATATAEATAEAGFLWDGGVGPVAGDAVNPSMGAWPRHPCRGHPRNRTHPAFDRFLRSVGMAWPAFGGCRPWSTRRSTPWVDALRIQFGIIEMNRMELEEIIHAWRGSTGRRETVEGGAVWVCRTVGAMDGAIEPPWMGLRRVLHTHTAPPSHGMSLLLRLLPLPLRVQGAALPNNPRYLWEPARTARRSAC